MIKIISHIISVAFFLVSLGLADSNLLLASPEIPFLASDKSPSPMLAKAKVRKKGLVTKARTKRKRAPRVSKSNSDRELNKVLQLVKQGQHEAASLALFRMSHQPNYKKQRSKIKYTLGTVLYQMGFNQLAAFQFVSLIKGKDKKYLNMSLEYLSLASNKIGDDSLLNYAISKININRFPKDHRDMLYYRIGEFQLRNKQMGEAAKSLGRVSPSSPFYNQAKYLQALSYSESNEIPSAVRVFNQLLKAQDPSDVTASNRVLAIMGKARAYYQGEKWDEAIKYYRMIPKDSEFWHDTLFESSWAMLRSGKFRSVLSNFQSLHSPYYEEFYLPESLLLRSIVYLYICKYDEMDKVLDIFNKIYRPLESKMNSYLTSSKDPMKYFSDVAQALNDYKVIGGAALKKDYELPFQVARKIMKEGSFQRSYRYIQKLKREEEKIQLMSGKWKSSAIGRYAKRVLSNRISRSRKKSGRKIRAEIIAIRSELRELFEQESFINFEKGNSQKESLKKIAEGKNIDGGAIDKGRSRDFYIKDGFEYWPFQGEYWLDEVGNYHYVGTHSCGS